MTTIALATHYGDNYGACLQAYATQAFLNDLGYDCCLIAYSPRMNGSFTENLFARNGLLHSPKKIVKKIKSSLFFLPKKMVKRYFLRERFVNLALRAEAFERFRQEYLTIEEKKRNSYREYYVAPPQSDIFVCGSDQLWNPTFYDRCNPVYYLDIAPRGKKRIAFATSIGLTEVPEKYRAEMKSFLLNMTAISVREEQGAKIVKDLTGRDVPVVVDPTFLLNADQWRRFKTRPASEISEPYVLLYLWGDLKYTDAFKKHVKEKTGLKVVALPYRIQERDGDDQCVYDAGPDDFARLIDNAALVVTDSFHATALSINFRTPFYTLLRQSNQNVTNMNSRFYSLIKKLQLQDRLFTPDRELPKEISYDVDFDSAYKILYPWRQESIDYLKKALEA